MSVPYPCTDPVFFASLCGQAGVKPPRETALTVQDAHDYRLSSLGAAVEWCKLNNLLGLLLDAELLVSLLCTYPVRHALNIEITLQNRIPSLIQGVKGFGLLVGAYGVPENVSSLSDRDSGLVDAFLLDGILTYFDHSKRS